MQYASASDDGSETTIGIENADGTDGIQIVYQPDLTLENQGYMINHPCPIRLAGDLNFDCIVDLLDIAVMSRNWLTDCKTSPTDPDCVSY